MIVPAWFVFAQQDSRALGIFLGAGAVGGMVGGVAFAALAQKLPQRTWLVGATALYGTALLGLFFLQPGSIAAIVVSFLAGSMLSVLFAVPFTAFYSRTPQKLLGPRRQPRRRLRIAGRRADLARLRLADAHRLRPARACWSAR